MVVYLVDEEDHENCEDSQTRSYEEEGHCAEKRLPTWRSVVDEEEDFPPDGKGHQDRDFPP